MDNIELDDLINVEYKKDEENITSTEIKKIISELEMYSNNKEMLTKQYTDILEDDNVIYLLTRISQNPIFIKHFPEFYEKNSEGENVINCQQNSTYHKYGVFRHILHSIDTVGKESLMFTNHDLKILKWTMLLHDIGKPKAKSINSQGNDSFAGHDEISVALASRIIDRFDFDEQDKNIILTLIKYHDKYLNEGELTYDNLSFLAKELGNQKDLFYLLIEVKIADNKSKSLEVYNKFMTVVGKYYDFANEYFANEEINNLYMKNKEYELEEDKIDIDIENIDRRGIYKEGGSNKEITEKIITQIVKDITLGGRLKCYYQPIVDVYKQKIDGYEIFYKIITEEDFSYKQIVKKAKEFDKYEKLQQMLFVNALERFKELKESNNNDNIIGYINIDAKSYNNYVNKTRIFDLIYKSNVVLEFNNFQSLTNSTIKQLSEEIMKRNACVAIDNFESSKKTIRDVEQMGVRCIKFKLKDLEENTKKQLQELSTYCLSNEKKLIVFGIEDKETFNFALDCGARYIQGEIFSLPMDGLDLSNEKVEKIIQDQKEELIV